MNINNFQAEEFTKDWLKNIFEKQQALLDKYKEIEGMPELPVSIHTHVGQKWIKDFLWRTNEELGESYEALVKYQETSDPKDAKIHEQHYVEELIDALHFLVELIIIVGKDWKWARQQLDSQTIEIASLNNGFDVNSYWAVSYYLCMVGNTLKNKPWKQTEMPTDEEKFDTNLSKAFYALFKALLILGHDEEQVYKYYTLKNQVNQFRQESAY